MKKIMIYGSNTASTKAIASYLIDCEYDFTFVASSTFEINVENGIACDPENMLETLKDEIDGFGASIQYIR